MAAAGAAGNSDLDKVDHCVGHRAIKLMVGGCFIGVNLIGVYL